MNTEEMVTLYHKGLSLAQIGKLAGRTRATISNHLKKTNIELRTSAVGCRLHTCRKHTINEQVFDTLSTESKYWLGFLMADGTISSNRVFTVCLAEIDRGHLEKLRKFLCSSAPIKLVHHKSDGKFKERTNVVLSICSKILVDKLAEFGVVSPRTHTAKATIDLSLDRDFWRGVVDGDGCLSTRTNGYPIISLCGSKVLNEQFLRFVQTHFETKAEVRRCGVVYKLGISGEPAITLIRKLYEDSTVYLDRKYIKADSILTIGWKKRRKLTKEEIRQNRRDTAKKYYLNRKSKNSVY